MCGKKFFSQIKYVKITNQKGCSAATDDTN